MNYKNILILKKQKKNKCQLKTDLKQLNHPKVKAISEGIINPSTGQLVKRGQEGQLLDAEISWFPNNLIKGPHSDERANKPEHRIKKGLKRGQRKRSMSLCMRKYIFSLPIAIYTQIKQSNYNLPLHCAEA